MNDHVNEQQQGSCKPGRTGIARVIAAAGYSWAGFQQAWQHEAAFRQEAVLGLLLLPIACWLGRDAVEIALLVGSCLVVLITELLNSAVEAVVDLASPAQHPLAGRAKDMGSAAVFVSLALVTLVWGSIIWRHFFA
ncbi:MAG TPA: diacylglycerol kinase [Pseudomonadales bacterium]|jgi:diacylglycerol kinase (ATP)|nr:diacylglycerol kinase [Pseudomonadales bacterium]HNI36814.1 diacylglycerol kinase [Pseudomonadales bacterium]HNL92044.1 diacylglycerol kinase [Pseudomonadales bacterium]HNN86142.1 diacylglycerol kinase [Pseudomonadales bacterium]